MAILKQTLYTLIDSEVLKCLIIKKLNFNLENIFLECCNFTVNYIVSEVSKKQYNL